MKILKTLTLAIVAMFITVGANAATLNAANGLAAGKALYSLYKQYKADGKLDFSNSTNVNNLISLVTNIKGLTTKSDATNTASSFISNLISGSQGLVTKSNTNNVLSTLGSIANLDVNSLATSAATSAVSSLLKKSGGSSSSSTSTVANTASSVLTGLFSSIGK